MNAARIKEIQDETAYPESASVQHALFRVWNECEQEQEKLREEGRQEIRDLVEEFRVYKSSAGSEVDHAMGALIRSIASKPQRYVVAPAGAALCANEARVGTAWEGPVYLKPGWTNDKECRDIVAKLLRDGVEVREA